MNIVFLIDGGAGRVISAMPALERYVKEHPKDNVRIFVYGWDALFWSNKTLQKLTFNVNDKGTFENFIKNADQVISPEPYRLPAYFNQKVSLVEAFDILINGKSNKNSIPKLYLSQQEKIFGKNIIIDVKKYQQKEKTVVIQPFGSTANFFSDGVDDEVVDNSYRSFNLLIYSQIASILSKKYNLLLLAEPKFHFPQDGFSYKLTTDLRGMVSVIDAADYFVGCDSVGQHMARAMDKPGTVIFGSTYPENVSYPNWFKIVDKNKDKRTYSPLRITDIDSNMADRNNSECMEYSVEDIQKICDSIIEDIEKKVPTKVQSTEQCLSCGE